MRQCSARLFAFGVRSALGSAYSGRGLGCRADWRQDWATLQNERHGFLIAYPVEVFQQTDRPTTDEGRVLYSPDGKASCWSAPSPTRSGCRCATIATTSCKESYAGAEIDYAPMRAQLVRAVRHDRRPRVLRAGKLHLRRPS